MVTDRCRPPLERLAGALGQRAARNAPLGARTTYRVGGSAALMVEADDEETLIACHRALLTAGAGVPVLVIGKGSNMLVADSGFAGLAICLGGEFAVVRDRHETHVFAGGAVGMQALARATASAGLDGFEWAVGIPGSLGGAVRMNAGGHGSEMSDVLVRARLFDLESGEAAWVGLERAQTGYRQSAVRGTDVVIGTELALRLCEPGAAVEKVAEVVRWRQANQPGGLNGGSVFKNPPGDSAGRLIDVTGLKGLRVRHGGGVPQACEFLPGRSQRVGRRCQGAHRSGPDARARSSGCRSRSRAAHDRADAASVPTLNLNLRYRFRVAAIRGRRRPDDDDPSDARHGASSGRPPNLDPTGRSDSGQGSQDASGSFSR